MEDFRRLDIELVSFCEGLDFTTTTGKLFFQIISAFAEFERDCIRERVRAGIRNAKAKGKRIGRSPHTPLSTETRKAIGRAYRRGEGSLRQLTARFGTSIGTVQRCIRAWPRAAVRRSGIQPRFRLYELRHTALSRMAMSGMDLPTLKELAGHSQIQMTMRYIHPTPEHKRQAIRQLEHYQDSLRRRTKGDHPGNQGNSADRGNTKRRVKPVLQLRK